MQLKVGDYVWYRIFDQEKLGKIIHQFGATWRVQWKAGRLNWASRRDWVGAVNIIRLATAHEVFKREYELRNGEGELNSES